MSVDGIKNGKVPPVFGSFGSQNQQHQRGQNPQGGGQNGAGQKGGSGGSGFDSADKFIEKTNVPVHNVKINPIDNSPAPGKIYYKAAKWGTGSASASDNVHISAELNGAPPDGSVKIHIIHEIDGQKTRIESIDGSLTKGVVSASWQAKNKGPNWNKGVYKFIVAGGGAIGESNNDLTLD